CLLFRNALIAWLIAMAATLLAAAISVALMIQISTTGPITYELGGWPAPWGIVYEIDWVGAFVLIIVSGIGATVAVYARNSINSEIDIGRHYVFYAMYLLSVAGLLGMSATGDVFNLFVFLEISSLSSYVLVSMGRDRRALTAAYRYLVMGTLGATFYIIGIAFLYMSTGTLNMADLRELLPLVSDSRAVLAAFAFITVGLCLKLALVPLHFWLPDAYTYAPSVVTAFLSATATKVAVYALIRLDLSIFGGTEFFTRLPIRDVLTALAVVAMVFASLVAVFQRDAKRMLAYSSLAQIGYMVLGIGMSTVTGLTGGIIHLFNHAITKGALFMAIGCVAYRGVNTHFDDLAGLGKRMPFTSAAIVIAGLSLVGVPVTAGFISKWYLTVAALEEGSWVLVVAILGSSLIAVVYVWRLVETMYMRQAAPDAAVGDAPPSMLVPLWLLTAACLVFGTNATWTGATAKAAATALLGVAP
ncbi:MAG: monovalent cation/H+ antiporter subunit D family protein, partial [Rhodospirillaceae bacterium]|nr:monovalent cation/H+ antiporter subunit D family protein [Rhodospirillaceae bacterium]